MRSIWIFGILMSLLSVGCASQQQLSGIKQALTRLQKDSALLEKQVSLLRYENEALKERSGLMEQSLTQLLEHKNDTIQQLQQQLRAKSNTLETIHVSRKLEETKYQQLNRLVTSEFEGYDTTKLRININQQGVTIWLNDTNLFVKNTAEKTYFLDEVLRKVDKVFQQSTTAINIKWCYQYSNKLKLSKEDALMSAQARISTLLKETNKLNKQLLDKTSSQIIETNNLNFGFLSCFFHF